MDLEIPVPFVEEFLVREVGCGGRSEVVVSFSSQGIDEAFVVSLAAAHAKALLSAASSLTLAETGAQSPSIDLLAIEIGRAPCPLSWKSENASWTRRHTGELA